MMRLTLLTILVLPIISFAMIADEFDCKIVHFNFLGQERNVSVARLSSPRAHKKHDELRTTGQLGMQMRDSRKLATLTLNYAHASQVVEPGMIRSAQHLCLRASFQSGDNDALNTQCLMASELAFGEGSVGWVPVDFEEGVSVFDSDLLKPVNLELPNRDRIEVSCEHLRTLFDSQEVF